MGRNDLLQICLLLLLLLRYCPGPKHHGQVTSSTWLKHLYLQLKHDEDVLSRLCMSVDVPGSRLQIMRAQSPGGTRSIS